MLKTELVDHKQEPSIRRQGGAEDSSQDLASEAVTAAAGLKQLGSTRTDNMQRSSGREEGEAPAGTGAAAAPVAGERVPEIAAAAAAAAAVEAELAAAREYAALAARCAELESQNAELRRKESETQQLKQQVEVMQQAERLKQVRHHMSGAECKSHIVVFGLPNWKVGGAATPS
jgi:hypothetical protein